MWRKSRFYDRIQVLFWCYLVSRKYQIFTLAFAYRRFVFVETLIRFNYDTAILIFYDSCRSLPSKRPTKTIRNIKAIIEILSGTPEISRRTMGVR